MSVPMLYGTCQGGPYAGKQMAHHELEMPIAIDRHSKKAHPCMQPTTKDPNYTFGDYRWNPEAKAWIWFEDSKCHKKATKPESPC